MRRFFGLGLVMFSCALLVQCPAPWHTFENPVDPKSPNYIGSPSLDNDGNGVPQYIDVEEIELISPAADESLASVTPVLTTYQFDPSLVQQYWFQVSTDSSFSTEVVFDNDSIQGNTLTIPTDLLVNNTTYFWRAKAYDGTKWSTEWSETRAFTIHLDMAVPSNPTPTDDSTVGDATPELDWSDAAGAEGYQIQIDDSVEMGSPFLDDATLVHSDYLITSLLTQWSVLLACSHQKRRSVGGLEPHVELHHRHPSRDQPAAGWDRIAERRQL